MAFLAAAAPYIGLASTAVGAYSQIQQGRIADANARVSAIQDEHDANAAQVESQAQASNERRRAKIIRSRALAVAGASGAGVDDPTISNILSDIEGEGEVRALNALYEGDYLAQGLRSGAEAKRRMGSASRNAGNLAAAGTLTESALENPEGWTGAGAGISKAGKKFSKGFSEDAQSFYGRYG